MPQLINQKYQLQKMPGKGGWTFIVIKEIPKENRGRFGALKVSGSIDDYKLIEINLMPMKNGQLFMPVKTEIRKAIKKEAGDWVVLKLNIPQQQEQLRDDEALMLCLKDEPIAYRNFLQYSIIEQQAFYNWIGDTKNDDVKVDRIAKAIDMITNKQKYKAQKSIT